MKEILRNKFQELYKTEPTLCLSCGGRFEILGNHTDHNHGLCIAATCSLSIYGAFKKRDDLLVHLYSEGFGESTIDLSNLDKKESETCKPTSLVRGIASYLSKDYKYGGLDIYINSQIPPGAGVSSSAAFELLIAQGINKLFNDEKIPLLTLCKASQYAESEYYGKKCGLLDQIGVAYGGIVYIDFKDIDNPIIERLHIERKFNEGDFSNLYFDDFTFVIVNSGGSHAGLDAKYGSISKGMKVIANHYGKDYLRDVDEEVFFRDKEYLFDHIDEYSTDVSEHFFKENQRVKTAYKVIKNDDFESLISLMNKSRQSSTELLCNMRVSSYEGSPLEACDLIDKASCHRAGVKINGGGFAGSVIALIPNDILDRVLEAVRAKYGNENVHIVSVRNEIPCEIK